MENKIYIIGGMIFLLLIGNIVFKLGGLDGNTTKNPEQTNPELEKYRSEEIPEDCRLPEYESDVDWWKQHLSHHKQTWYCLDYYGTSIEEMTNP